MKLLFICNQNQHRSRTAEIIFKEKYNTKSAGIFPTAETVLTSQALEWADIVFVMKPVQRKFIAENFPAQYLKKQIITLDIPDIYNYMDPRLVEMLEKEINEALKDGFKYSI